MGVIVKGNKLVIVTKSKTNCFDLIEKVDNTLSMKLILSNNTMNF